MADQIDVVATIEGSVQDGGWKASGSIFNNADELTFYRRLAIWMDSYFGGAWESSPRNAFQGHLLPDPWTKTIQGSTAGFTAYTAQGFLKQGELQGIYFRHVDSSPANRHQIINMNYAKIVYELISGHCNLMHMIEAANYDSQLWGGAIVSQTYYAGFMLLDLDITASSATTEYQMKAGNFWQRIQEMADIDFFIVYMDKFNRLHFVPHPMFDASLPDPVLTITSAHILAPLKFERHNTEAVGQVKLFGTTPAGTQISGKYPDNPTAGPVVTKSSYLATSSSQMTTIATRMYKYENRDYTVTAVFPSAIGLLLDLLDRVSITYTSSGDGIAWTAKKFWVHRIKVDIGADFNAETELTLEAENA